MFFSKAQIIRSLKKLEDVHPFYGVTFLTCKKNNLPVGDSIHFPINHLEEELLNNFYKPDQGTTWFYRPFRVSDKTQHWWRYDYPSSGSQSTRTRKFSTAFIHEKNTDVWGWQKNYVEVLRQEMYRKAPISIFDLAVWIYRDIDWESSTTQESVIRRFMYDFGITSLEYELLFYYKQELFKSIFSPQPALWEDIREEIGSPPPPDARLHEGGSLRMLTTEGAGPAERLEVNFSSRINIITGDNGLGKTFLLETAWWALTGAWSTEPMYPNQDFITDPKIVFQIASPTNRTQTITSVFDPRSQSWVAYNPRTVTSGLVLYARVDGSFSIWDPIRSLSNDLIPTPLHFSRSEVWNGLQDKKESKFNNRYICNGLISDWVLWQNTSSKPPFRTLEQVLRQLSPPKDGDLGLLSPGQPRRLTGESRPIPTIKHSYGEVPLTQASEAVKRIVALAYLLVWTWSEHQAQAHIIKERPQKKMVVIIDEIESHLHPQWQRRILPALNEALHGLEDDLSIQIIATTHSPLVLSSLEPIFQEGEDNIFHLNIAEQGRRHTVIVEDPEFAKYGSADSWLKSSFFEMKQAMSVPAEKIAERAKKYMQEGGKIKKEIAEISDELYRTLPDHNPLVARWKMYAERYGPKKLLADDSN
jgi:hypothetical protein